MIAFKYIFLGWLVMSVIVGLIVGRMISVANPDWTDDEDDT